MNGTAVAPLQHRRERNERVIPTKLSKERIIGIISAEYEMGENGRLIGTDDVYLASLYEMMKGRNIGQEKAERYAGKLGLKGKEREIFIEGLTEGEVEVDGDKIEGLFARSRQQDKNSAGGTTAKEISSGDVVVQIKKPASEGKPENVPSPNAPSPKGMVAETPTDTSKTEITEVQAIESAGAEESQGEGAGEEALASAQTADTKPKKKRNKRQPAKLTEKEWAMIFFGGGDYADVTRMIIKKQRKTASGVSVDGLGKSRPYLSVLFFKKNFCPDVQTHSKLVLALEIPQDHIEKYAELRNEFELLHGRKKKEKKIEADIQLSEEQIFNEIKAKGEDLLQSTRSLLALNDEEIARVAKRLIRCFLSS